MLKTIPTHQVVIGMHIHALKGAWVDHPFWKTRFVLDDIQDLKKLQTSIIKEVVIDTEKGLDVPAVSLNTGLEAEQVRTQDALSTRQAEPEPQIVEKPPWHRS